MRLFRHIVLVVLLCSLYSAAFGAPAGSKKPASEPDRLISLSPGVTEMLFALGLGPKVVGDTTFCDYPPAAKAVEKIGDSTTNYERVISLRPDLVIVDTVANTSAMKQLKRFPLKVLAVSPFDYMGTERALLAIGAATGSLDRAKLVVKKMEVQRVRAAAIASKDPGRAPRVLVVVSTSPLWSAGAHTFVGDLIARAGGINIAAHLNNYAPYSREAVLAAQPDVILVGKYDIAAFLKDPAMRALAAVKQGRVYSVADNNTIVRPGPRLGDGLLTIARLLHSGSK